MAYKSAKCYVCHEIKAAQDHHLLPLEYGGPKDGPTVKLCPSCHLICHYESSNYFNTGDYDRLEDIFTSAALDRALRVISYILQQRVAFEDAGKPAQDARRTVQLHFTHDELLLLHNLKRLKKFRSLERLIKACVFVEVTKQRQSGKL